MIISIIVALSENNAIGKNGKIPWHLPNDLKHFKKVTLGHHIIMGRKTYDSIGKPLPGRTNVVISHQKDLKIDGCEVVNSLGAALAIARLDNQEEVFIIGGASIYKSMLSDAEKLYLTRVHTKVIGADTFFPEIDSKMWIETKTYPYLPDEEHDHAYTIEIFERRM